MREMNGRRLAAAVPTSQPVFFFFLGPTHTESSSFVFSCYPFVIAATARSAAVDVDDEEGGEDIGVAGRNAGWLVAPHFWPRCCFCLLNGRGIASPLGTLRNADGGKGTGGEDHHRSGLNVAGGDDDC